MKQGAAHPARKRFGQHFLHDPSVIARMVSAIAPNATQHFVEIGPGRGALTVPLLKRGARVDAIEIDRDLAGELERRLGSHPGLRIHNADALDMELARLQNTGNRLRVVGNLPYNISTPLLFHFIAQCPRIADMHFMLQREVVERITAEPGSRAYGRLSVMVQIRCDAAALFQVGRGAFYPVPGVTSAVVRLVPHRQAPASVCDSQVFAEVVKRVFSTRRKTIRNCLKGILAEGPIRALGVDPGARPETLSLDDFARLANEVARAREGCRT